MNDQPGDIRMFVQSEPYEVECDCTESSRAIYEHRAADSNTHSPNCPDCHGIGKRTVRLAGLVCNIVIDPAPGNYVSGIEGWIIVDGKRYCKTSGYYPELFSSDPFEAFPIYKLTEELHRNVIEAHRAGTLPPELYKSDDNPMGLEESNAVQA